MSKRPPTKDKGRRVNFAVDHMDPMGQGVSRDGKLVTFIAGTLPGEAGQAVVYKKSKGVQFATLSSLENSADNRCEPQCPHFSQCPGCHYLHTDYASELSYKRSALVRHLSQLSIAEDQIELVPAPSRLSYRNRVQLHYRHKYIGMLDPVNNRVVEIPHCKIIDEKLQPAFDQLYEDKSWTEANTGHGHCELYLKDGAVGETWNDDYAHGGFSQVNNAMNGELQARVDKQLTELKATRVLDLFSGKGNLSDGFASAGGQRVLVDSFWDVAASEPPQNFVKLDLFDDDALKLFFRRHGKEAFDTLLVDPPRRGFAQLDTWVKKAKPKYLVYVSCNPASLARDLRGLSSKFEIVTLTLLDLFPATYHFETLIVLRFR
ncbi:MAG: 23S rRNA (uracil1939-C5)-methyltransferase [Halioglobus sp.]|jgi:23S rRNA (uracil1939-C5)-methyltransferase